MNQTLASITAADARGIAKDAYIYGYPLVDSYRIQHAYFVDRRSREYKGGWNQVHNTARVYTPDDKAVQTPNSDTPYSYVAADLRAEPLVLSVPEVERDRYYSLQFIDLCTYNFAYLGTRTTGNDAGRFLLAGPGWKGDVPAGVKDVIRSETELVFVLYRTQLLGSDDIGNVEKIQAGYQVQTLSAFLGTSPPPSAPAIDFATPLTVDQQRSSLEFFNILGFVLQFCPTHPSEEALIERFAALGICAGSTFDFAALSPQVRQAMEDGISDAWQLYDVMDKRMASGERTSADVFGTRECLKDDYLSRMAGAVHGIYGNSKDEAIYPVYTSDSAGNGLDGSRDRYVLRFSPGQLPPVNAFWSLTMYELPSRMLVRNRLGRYLINSPMLPTLKRDGDGALSLYVQRESPRGDKASNWLPAPDGPFVMVLRLYWPKPEALSGAWKQPPLERVKEHDLGATIAAVRGPRYLAKQ
jgi:hypothetical protein